MRGAILWTIGYDTIYAHQDKEDDAMIGVRSTALLFGAGTKRWMTGIYGLAVVLMAIACLSAGAPWPAYVGLLAAAVLLGWQIAVLDIDDPDQCLALFKSNTRVGWLIFGGLVLAILAA